LRGFSPTGSCICLGLPKRKELSTCSAFPAAQCGNNDDPHKCYYPFSEITTQVYLRTGSGIGNAAVDDRTANTVKKKKKWKLLRGCTAIGGTPTFPCISYVGLTRELKPCICWFRSYTREGISRSSLRSGNISYTSLGMRISTPKSV
jgi:hypothetical protein